MSNKLQRTCTQRVTISSTISYLFRSSHTFPSVSKARQSLRTKTSFLITVQEIGLPQEAVDQYVRTFHSAQGSWSVCICLFSPPSTFGRWSFAVSADLQGMFWSLRFAASGIVNEGVMERWLRGVQGLRFLHCRAPRNEDTAWVLQNDRWYGDLRSR